MKTIGMFYNTQFAGMTVTVYGFAIDSGLPVRVCVHKVDKGVWVCDHYDSGRRFGESQRTKRAAVRHAVYEMRRRIESGAYAQAVHELNNQVRQ